MKATSHTYEAAKQGEYDIYRYNGDNGPKDDLQHLTDDRKGHAGYPWNEEANYGYDGGSYDEPDQHLL